MLIKDKCLLIIDNTPQDEHLIEYFAQFNFTILHYQSLIHLLNEKIAPPAAILLNWISLQNSDLTIEMLYQRFSVPILVISDHSDERKCVQLLEAGADDFLVKPLHPRELHARITAINRRILRANKEMESEKEALVFANWRLYPAARQIFNDKKQELLLSVGEYDLLLAFLRRPQQVLGREFLLQITKNSGLNPFDRRIDVQISRLRQKIESDPKKNALIKTIRNNGYLFTVPVLAIKERLEINPKQ